MNNTKHNKNLIKTGERVIEDEYKKNRNEYFIYLCHIATYNFVKNYVKNKKVLEFGCGSGYGSELIADSCRHITAVDISEDAINFAQSHYSHDNLAFQVIKNIETTNLDFDDDTFEVVISFQVIEHIANSSAYINELYRVLKPGGTFIVVTPDRTHRLFTFQKPWNMYHVKEFNMASLIAVVSQRFKPQESFYMSARKDLIAMEMKRTKKLRMIMLPFTLFFMPEKLRVLCISFAKKLTSKKPKSTENATIKHDFSVDDITITKDANNSINIFVVAKKSLIKS